MLNPCSVCRGEFELKTSPLWDNKTTKKHKNNLFVFNLWPKTVKSLYFYLKIIILWKFSTSPNFSLVTLFNLFQVIPRCSQASKEAYYFQRVLGVLGDMKRGAQETFRSKPLQLTAFDVGGGGYSISRSFQMTERFTLSLRLSPAPLQRKLILAACICNLFYDPNLTTGPFTFVKDNLVNGELSVK